MTISWRALKDARARKGWTQNELASELGVHAKTIVNWEKAGVPPKSEYKVLRVMGDDLRYARYVDGLPSNMEPDTFEAWKAQDTLMQEDAEWQDQHEREQLGEEDYNERREMEAAFYEMSKDDAQAHYEKWLNKIEALSPFTSHELLNEVSRRITESEHSAKVTELRPRQEPNWAELDKGRKVAKHKPSEEPLDRDAD